MFEGLRRRHYGAISIDPPWEFRSYAPSANPESSRNIERHYETMAVARVAALPVAALAAKDAHLFMWTTGPHLANSFAVMAAWGFDYSGTAFVWIKLKDGTSPARRIFTVRDLHYGLGFTTRKNAEFCLLGRRGNARRKARDVFEVIVSPVREHSRKPDEAFERIERYCSGPYLDLFGRQQRPRWRVWGNESGKFKE